MYRLLSACLVGLVGLSNAASRNEVRDVLTETFSDYEDRIDDYLDFVDKYGKLGGIDINNNEELENRFLNWKATDDKIQSNGNSDRDWTYGHTRFSDWSDNEKKGILLDESFINSEKQAAVERDNCLKVRLSDSSELEESSNLNSKQQTSFNTDNRAYDIAGIQDQGECASCWDFSDVGTLEINRNLDFGYTSDDEDSVNSFVKLSEQYVLDCTDDDVGTCDGGYPIFTLMWVTENAGIVASSDYGGYTEEEGTCDSSVITTDSSIFEGLYCLEDETPEQVSYAASMFGVEFAFKVFSQFYNYESGVYSCDVNDEFLGWHAVTMVGVTDDYFIVKNSWSTDWGDDGYFLMNRDSFADCGMSHFAFVSFNDLEDALKTTDSMSNDLETPEMDISKVATIRSKLQEERSNSLEKQENLPGLEKIQLGGKTNERVLIGLGSIVALSIFLCLVGVLYKSCRNCKTRNVLKAVVDAQRMSEETALLDGYTVL